MLNEKYTLSNGVEIPKLGLGTWMIPDEQTDEAVRAAVSLGYRHIDTAQAYGNEAGVGRGVKSCGVDRDKLFVTSKVAAEHKSYETAAKSIDETLEKTGLDYLDMMIIHAPQPWAEFRGEKRYFEENKEAWRALEDAYKAGKLRAIGVSNFLVDDLENLLADAKIKPMVNQILTHISNTPLELIDFCKANGIQCEAYSPIAHGEALKNKAIADMAAKYGVSAAQLCVRYTIDLGMVSLPKTANPEHMKSNSDIDFTISAEDMETLKHFDKIKDYGEYSFFPVFSGK
ncbi:MAG TPA: 2,5-diketo-D-gluconic acid reductase [Ruminococcaceae bacterium]|nr:2,5-diketo-D-gluconic acid reductase [Oscillospiraceae bacterium]